MTKSRTYRRMPDAQFDAVNAAYHALQCAAKAERIRGSTTMARYYAEGARKLFGTFTKPRRPKRARAGQ